MSAPRSAIERELQLKSDALEHSLNGFDIVDAEGRFVYANRAYLDMWGYESLDEIVGTSPAGHCADPSVADRIIAELKASGECTIEFLARRKDGSTFDVRMWARLAHDAEGREIYPTTSIDITEEKRAARSARLLSAVTDVLIAEVDVDQAVERVARVIVPDLADCCIVDLLSEAGTPLLQPVAGCHGDSKKQRLVSEYRARLHAPAEGTGGVPGVVRTGTAELHSPAAGRDGPGIHSYLCVPLRARGRILGALTLILDEGARRFDERDVATAQLLSDRVALSVDNALLYRNAQEAIRSRDEFISICSHELKTPVTSMKLQFQTAQRQVEQDDPAVFGKDRVKARIAVVLRQVERMSKLIDDMLDVSRIATGKLALDFERVDLGAVVQEVVDRFAEQFAVMNVPLSYDRPAVQDAAVRGDRLRLEQVVTNLLTNALKYGGGHPVSVTLRVHEGSAEVAVHDRGIGIAPEDVGRIFRRFERIASTSNVGGLGLGLYITREIVEAHGGEIQVESSPGTGTTFVVRLPLAPAGG